MNPKAQQLLKLSEDLVATGQLQESLLLHNQAAELEPGNWEIVFRRAALQLDLENPAEALADAELAFKYAGDQPESMRAIIRSFRGKCKAKAGQNPGALEDLDAAIDAAPNFPEVRKNRGDFHFNQQHYEKAITDYAVALARHSEQNVFDPGMYSKVAHCFEKTGRRREGQNLFYKVIDHHLRAKRMEEALAACDEALELAPDWLNTRAMRMKVLADAGRHEEAIAEAERVSKLDTQGEMADGAAAIKGNAYNQLGQTEKAVKAFEEAVKANPEHASHHIRLSVSLVWPAIEKAGRAKIERALGCVDTAIALAKKQGDAETLQEAVDGKVMLLKGLGRHEEAARLAASPPSVAKGCGGRAAAIALLPFLLWAVQHA